jgi:serine/threonine-protein kinase Psk1
MCQGKPYSIHVDYWAIGILLHELITGSPPFTGQNNKLISDRIVNSKLKLPYYISPDAKDLITKLLKKVPSARLGSKPDDVAKFKSHRFFRKIDWAELEGREVTPPIRPVITDLCLAENFPRFNALQMEDVTRGEAMVGSPASETFQGFTYTASSSFIDRFLMK